METQQNNNRIKARKHVRHPVRNTLLFLLTAAAIGAGAYLLLQKIGKKEESVSVVTWQASSVAEGEVSAVLSGSGTLTSIKSTVIYADGDMSVEEVLHKSGDRISKGETVLRMSSEEIEKEIEDQEEKLEDLRKTLSETSQYRTDLTVSAGVSGVVKDIQASVDSLCEELPYLCLISTDRKSRIEFPPDASIRKYDEVIVEVSGKREDGIVTELTEGTAIVLIDTAAYDCGSDAAVYSKTGELLGTGNIGLNEYVKVTVPAGRIRNLYVRENLAVSSTRTLFRLGKGAPTEEYLSLKEEEQEILDSIAELQEKLVVTAPYDCILLDLPVSKGDEIQDGTAICQMDSVGGFILSIAIDEQDLASVSHGQKATITLDALEGTFHGTVTNISYVGTGSYVTSYTAIVRTDPIENAYPGMSASAEIITETSGTGMVISVNALQRSKGETFVYLAPESATDGTVLKEEEIDFDSLKKAAVETGMSDGTYISVRSDELSAGDTILVPNRTTSAVYVASENVTTTFAGMGGGMTGGNMPGGNWSGSGRSGSNSGSGSGRNGTSTGRNGNSSGSSGRSSGTGGFPGIPG